MKDVNPEGTPTRFALSLSAKIQSAGHAPGHQGLKAHQQRLDLLWGVEQHIAAELVGGIEENPMVSGEQKAEAMCSRRRRILSKAVE